MNLSQPLFGTLLKRINCAFCVQKKAASTIPIHIKSHIPIFKEEVVALFQPSRGKTYIDMTFGSGGHSTALLEACPDINIIGLDRDPIALKYGRQLEHAFGQNVQLLHGTFTDLIQLLKDRTQDTSNIADGILFDVGASTMQFSNRKRGFALKSKGPLDMRMNGEDNGPTAADLINKLEEKDLFKILKKYGQEKLARQIARQMVEHRQMMGPILTTRELQDLVCEVYMNEGMDKRNDKLGRKQHPATLTFQALRIFVNDELNQLYNGLKVAHRLLKPVGVCATITFHSLEHNIVHQVFNASAIIHKETLATSDLHHTARLFPFNSDRRALKPTAAEIEVNPRGRSAELRVAYKKSINY